MVGTGLVESIDRFASLVLTSSRYLAFLTLVVGAVVWGTGTNTRRQHLGIGMLCGGAGALVVYFALESLVSLLTFLVAGPGPAPSTTQAMFAPGIHGAEIATQGGDNSLYRSAAVFSTVAAVAGQAFIAWGAALYGISPSRGRVHKSSLTSFKTGLGLVVGSMSGILLSFLPLVFPSLS
jgi:hypothetical protein